MTVFIIDIHMQLKYFVNGIKRINTYNVRAADQAASLLKTAQSEGLYIEISPTFVV
jgi:hypothetical protein